MLTFLSLYIPSFCLHELKLICRLDGLNNAKAMIAVTIKPLYINACDTPTDSINCALIYLKIKLPNHMQETEIPAIKVLPLEIHFIKLDNEVIYAVPSA